MTTFVTWNKDNDVEARTAFQNITGVQVQEHPLENAQGTHFMVGYKITLQQYQALNETELFRIKNSTPPSFWEPLEIPIEDV